MITIKADIKLNEEDAKFIRELQRQQSAIIRSAYNIFKTVDVEKECRAILKDRFYKKESYPQMDSWFIQSALQAGQANLNSDNALNLSGRIYGGKKNFIARSKNEISYDKFKESRLLPLYLVGDASRHGNRKFDFISETEVLFKPLRCRAIKIALPKFRKNYTKKLKLAFEMANAKEVPITISLTLDTISFSFKEPEQFHKSIKTRYAGIDINPNNVGISVFDGDRMIASRIYTLHDLTKKNGSDDKLEFESFEVGNDIAKMMRHLQVSKVFIEDLSKIRKTKLNKGKRLNQLCINKWKREKLLRPIQRSFDKNCIVINAAYTSTIGNVLNSNLPDPVAASIAIANRGYEIMIAKSRKFYPALPETKDLEDRWKKTDVPKFQDWKDLHSWLKETGLKYRVAVPDIAMFRNLSSRKSQVYILDNFRYN